MKMPKWLLVLFLLVGAYLFGGLTVKYRLFPLKRPPEVPLAKAKNDPANKFAGTELLRELMRGGYVLYFRHAARESDYSAGIFALESLMSVTQKEIRHPTSRYAVCLNEKGKVQSWLINELFRELKIPVGKVVSSPICRSMETAQLAFGKIDELHPALVHPPLQLPEQKEEFKNKKLKLLATLPAPGTNTVVVAHGGGTLEQTGISYSKFNQSDTIIMKSLGENKVEFIAKMTLLDWANLLERKKLEGYPYKEKQ